MLTQTVNAGDARVDYRVSDERLALRPLLHGQAELRRPVARQHLHGRRGSPATNNSESNNYNGVLGLHADPRLEQVLRGAGRLQPLLDAPVRRGLRRATRTTSSASRTATSPPIPETLGHRQLPARRLRATRARRARRTRSAWARTYHLTGQLLLDPRQAQLQGRRGRSLGAAAPSPTPRRSRRGGSRSTATTRAGPVPPARATRFATMLLGYPNRIQRDVVDTWPLIRRNFVGLFVQDDLRVSRKLSVQLGLRWDLMTPPVQVDDKQSNFIADRRPHPPRLGGQPRPRPQDAVRLRRSAASASPTRPTTARRRCAPRSA